MSYILRDRPDGQFEIVISRPIVVGVFPERDTAEKIHVFLQADDPDVACAETTSCGQASRDVREAEADDLFDLDAEGGKPVVSVSDLPAVRKASKAPAVVDKPRMAVQINQASYWPMSEEDTRIALARIQQGEKVVDVAKDYPVSMGQLRGKWANYKRNLQRYMAEAGPQPCRLCAREFTPSVSNPDTCARCSK